MSIATKKCKICQKVFSKVKTVSRKTWKTKSIFCSIECATISRSSANRGEKHYNWKGGFNIKEYYKKHPEIHKIRKERAKEIDIEKRLLVLRFYSKNDVPFCNCCGIKGNIFLAIDHIENNGAKHNRERGSKSRLVDWIIKNNLPKGFQILCYNCNIAKYLNHGMCPHKE